MDWDDVRLFLELVRQGSARGAAAQLGVSHSTIVRRVERLEARLDVRLFDRDFTGYRPTASGETLMTSALAAEDAILTANRQLHGQDDKLNGAIVVTMPDILANYLLMPDLVRFSELFPDIELTVNVSYDLFDLSRREADVAIRAMGDGRTPPEDLVGRKLIRACSSYYAAPAYLEKHDLRAEDSGACWIGWDDAGPYPDWVKNSDFPHVPARGHFNNVMLQGTAVQAGLGLASLPCFMGDALPGVVRIPGCKPFENYDLWLLSHPDLRDAARHREFRKFIVEACAKRRGEFLGK